MTDTGMMLATQHAEIKSKDARIAELEAEVERLNREAADWQAAAADLSGDVSKFGDEVARLRSVMREMGEALDDLLQVIATDELIPESVSYMQQARAAFTKWKETQK